MTPIIPIGTGAGKRHMPWLMPAVLLKRLTANLNAVRLSRRKLPVHGRMAGARAGGAAPRATLAARYPPPELDDPRVRRPVVPAPKRDTYSAGRPLWTCFTLRDGNWPWGIVPNPADRSA